MKNFLLSILSLFFFSASAGAFVNPHTAAPIAKNANEIFIPVGSGGKFISLMELSKISVKDFQALSGRHFNFLDRALFKAGQRKLKRSIAADGTVKNKKLTRLLSDGDHSTGFHIGGFALGFFLGLIGVLLAYVIGGDEDVKRNRAKWAWIGLGVYVVAVLVLILVVLKSHDAL